jgi:(S)-mandelate dehydrogenase
LDLLPTMAEALDGRIELLLDGGLRRGSDLLKARALGAKALLSGRATLFGALVAGEPGAARALEILRDELVRTMQLAGVSRFDAVDATCLAKAGRDATCGGAR